MYVEDLIKLYGESMSRVCELGSELYQNNWNREFIGTLYKRVILDKPLSAKQANAFLRLVNQTITKSNDINLTQHQIKSILACPQYRQPPYESSDIPREVRYLGQNRLGVRCKRIENIITDIKALKSEFEVPFFDTQHKIWIVPVNSKNFKKIMSFIACHDFNVDDAVLEYLALCDSSKNQPSNFVHDPENNRIIANVCDNEIMESWIKNVVFGRPI